MQKVGVYDNYSVWLHADGHRVAFCTEDQDERMEWLTWLTCGDMKRFIGRGDLATRLFTIGKYILCK